MIFIKKIRILYSVSNLKRCGPINILYNLIKYIDKGKYEIYIVSLSPEVESSRQKEFEILGCKVLNLNLGKFNAIFKAKNIILEIIKENNIDIVHSHGIRADFINASLKNKKNVSTLHNYPYDDYKMEYGKLAGFLLATSHIFILKKMKNVYACSKSINDMLLMKNIYFDYVQNGVDDKIFTLGDNNEKHKIRKELNLSKDKIIYVVIGELNNRKDVSTIVNCFNERKNTNEILLIIGSGKLYNQSKNQSKDNLNIIFKGRVNNVEKYLKASDYYISASLAEGLPNSVLEAMAVGLPCILSKIKPHEEIINDLNQLFIPKDTKNLSQTIDYVTNENYQYLKNKSRLTIENKFNAQRMAISYENKYIEIL